MFNGTMENFRVGWSVAGVGDVNGDHIDDLIIGALFAHEAYLVFGMEGAWPESVALMDSEPNVVPITGDGPDGTGHSVGSAGDVNQDGRPDIAIGAPLADPSGNMNAGCMYVLYGRPSNSAWPPMVNLPAFADGMDGFSVVGNIPDDNCGLSVSGVGDVNNDGVDDVAVACPGKMDSASDGFVAVIFGSVDGLPMQIMTDAVSGGTGFLVTSPGAGDRIGLAVSCVGDVNADDLDDFAIGTYEADVMGVLNSGALYVLFGRNTTWPDDVVVADLDGNIGFTLAGSMAGEGMGESVSAAGDVNMDGIDDFLVGAHVLDGGYAYLLYGREQWNALLRRHTLNVNEAVTFEGAKGSDWCGSSVSLLGDVDGDGRGDWAIGCPGADPDSGMQAGQAAVVFGPLFTSAPTVAPTTSPITASPTSPPIPTDSPTSTVSPTTSSPTTAFPTNSPTTKTPTNAPTTTAPTNSPTTTSPTNSPTTMSPTNTPVTSSPTTSPTMPSATPSPTPATCNTEGAFIPPGATCVNGVLVTTSNTTAPPDMTVTVTTSVTISGGASFEQPTGSTLVFVAGGSAGQGTTSIAVQDGGCATIEGDAVVSFEEDPSNGGASSNTGPLVLVTADCVVGAFGSVSATAAFDGADCVDIGDGDQQASASSVSVTFTVSNTCGKNSSGLSTGALVGIILGAVVVTAVVVIVLVKLSIRARYRRAESDVKMSPL